MPSKREIALMKSIARKRDQWEAVWAEYVEAEADVKEYHEEIRRGLRPAIGKGSGHRGRTVFARLRKARERVRRLQPELARSLGI